MTWSSRRAETLARGMLAVALVSSVACVEERILETQALVVAESTACTALRDVRGETINSYRVMLFEVAAGAPEEDRCGPCLREGRCRLREMVCGCGPSHVPTTFQINRDLEGLRFRDLPPGIEICLGLVGADVPSLPSTERREECDCSSVITPDATARLCGVSPFSGTVEENAPAIVIDAECRSPMLPFCPLALIRPP